MTAQDIETQRAEYRERYHRRTAERRARGLCTKCGKRPPTQGRSQCEPCAAKKRPADRARHHRRTAERVAQGLCPKCGKRPPVPERSQCEPCLAKDAAAGRARDARLRAAGLPRRDPAREREYTRERIRRQTEARKAEGLCTACGKAPAVPGRVSCEPCLEKRRAQDREKYAAGKAAGKLYGGADPEVRRRAGRARSRRLRKAWREAGLCVRCGKPPAVEGGTICTSCREKRRARARRKYAERRAAGLCVKCAVLLPGGKTYCGSCAAAKHKRRPRDPEARREADRRRYAERRARGDCTSCGEPANGAAECEACRDAARARYHVRRAAGVCVKCRTPTFGGAAYCAPCAVAKEARRDPEAEQAARRRRYTERRARGRCVECGTPSPGAARCEPCSLKHRERSGRFRGIPVWDPTWTVIEIATGEALGTFDSEADVALCLAFAKLGRDQVEVLHDASPMSSFTSWT